MATILTLCRLDFYKLLYYRRSFIIFFAAIGFCFFVPDAFSIFYMITAYFFGATLIALDEGYKTNYLYSTLPVSRQQIITARYTFFLGSSLLLLLLFSIVTAISPFKQNLSLIMFALSFCFAFNLLFFGFIQALCFRFKYNIVRMIMVIVYVIIFTTISNLLPLLKDLTFFTLTLPQGLIVICAGALILFALSYVLAIRLYQHKDFLE